MEFLSRKFKLLGLIALVGVFSCTKDKPSNPKQSEVVNRYLEFKTKMNAFSESYGQMSNFLDVIAASQLHSKAMKLKFMTLDSTYNDTIPVDTSGYWNYLTCAKVSEFENNDGTHTTVYDYGDGCNEFGSLIKGKITYVWSNVGNSYYSKVLYDNYYSYGTEMNGYSEYTFTSDGNSYVGYDTTGVAGDSIPVSNIIFYWSGSSTCKDDVTVIYDTGEKYVYTSDFSTKWENSTYSIIEGDFTYSSFPDGYRYHYLVAKPLVYNYDCPSVWVAVTGIESIHYDDPTKIYDFVIDYGEGDCDNLATIIENGESSVIDFSELLYIYCGTDSVTCNGGRR